jgi:uncharacterized protein (TIGR00661 family)
MRILVAVLNWGLGHASRCVPLIEELRRQQAEVIVASDGLALTFLNHRFPDLHAVVLPSYGVRYRSRSMFWNMLCALPRIVAAIGKEHRVIRHLVNQYKIDAIISDHRYGCFHKKTYSALLIHQIYIQCPPYLKMFEPMLFELHRLLLKPFQTLLIPDYDGPENLSGDLSHKRRMTNMQFIGPLSHVSKRELNTGLVEYDLLIICSGPEPARTRFERLMMDQLSHGRLRAALVRGSDQPASKITQERLTVFNLPGSDELSDLMAKSGMVICRAGYSSIMDLAATGKNAILIPTPGQTEQEFLADYHSRAKRFYSVREKNFNLQQALHKAREYQNNFTLRNDSQLKTAIASLLENIRKQKKEVV